MSKGLGRIQRGLLEVLRQEAKLIDTLNLAAKVYQVECPNKGEWNIDAQKCVAVRRALAGLMKQGLIGRRRGFNDGIARWGVPSAVEKHDQYLSLTWEQLAQFRAFGR